jgi:iron complex outermembrane receptor protein
MLPKAMQVNKEGEMVQRRLAALLCGTCAAALWSTAASAQETDRQQASAQGSSGNTPIVVTAQRREENLQDVPIAASVLSGEELENQGVDGLVALQFAAPGLSVTDISSANILNIRGIGRSAVDIELSSGVVIYRDGVPTFPGYFQNEPYYDIESIEVLRGPQGTFVGKSAAGGAIFINTASPDLSGFSGRIEGEVGNFDQFGGTAIVNAPLSSEFAVRVAYHHFERGEPLVDSLTGPYTGRPGRPNLDSIRFGALWEPTNNFSFELRVDLSDLDFGGGIASAAGLPLYDLFFTGDYDYVDRSARVVGQFSYTFDSGHELRSTTGYQFTNTVNDNGFRGRDDTFGQFESSGDFELISEEINLISPSGPEHPFSYVIGAFAQRTDQEIFEYERDGFNIFGAPGDLGGFVISSDFPYFSFGAPYRNREDELAVFADLRYRFSDQWEAEFGIRYSRYEVDNSTNIVFGNGASPPALPFYVADQGFTENDVDGKLAITFHPTPDHNIYALVARGHVTAGFGLANGLYFDKEIVWSYEGGWKATWAGGTVTTQVGAFYQTLSNFQAQFEEENLQINVIRNSLSGSEIYGLEAAIQARLGNFNFDASLALLESNLGTYPPVVSPFTGQVVTISGAQAPFSPSFAFNALASYEFPLGGEYTLTPRATFSYVSSQNGTLIEDPSTTMGSRTLVNAGLRLDSGRWYAELWATNLFDERYLAGVQNFGNQAFPGPPRQYGLRFGIRFGE